MPQDLVISYVHNSEGRVDEEFDDVESFECLNNPDGDGKTLIVRQGDSPPNKTRENVDHLIGSEEQSEEE